MERGPMLAPLQLAEGTLHNFCHNFPPRPIFQTKKNILEIMSQINLKFSTFDANMKPFFGIEVSHVE